MQGRKAGYLVDVGGSVEGGESPIQAAVREAFEEGLSNQFSLEELQRLFDCTHMWHKGFHIDREDKNWRLYFVRIQKFDLTELNRSFESRPKRREFFWIPIDDLLAAHARAKKLKKSERQIQLPVPGVPPNIVWNRLKKMKLKKKLRMLKEFHEWTDKFCETF